MGSWGMHTLSKQQVKKKRNQKIGEKKNLRCHITGCRPQLAEPFAFLPNLFFFFDLKAWTFTII